MTAAERDAKAIVELFRTHYGYECAPPLLGADATGKAIRDTLKKSVSELVELTRSPQGRVSTHLGCLRWCGFVASRREGKRVYYRIADDRVRALLGLGQELMAEHAQEILACGIVSPDVAGATIHLTEVEGGRDE